MRRLSAWCLLTMCTLSTLGCMSGLRMKNQLRSQVAAQASSIPDIYYREVLNNLAMIEADPSRMPYFSDPQTSRSVEQQSVSGSYGVFADLISTAPTGVLTLFDRYLLDRQSASVTGTQRNTGEWAALTANDPDKLFTMRAAYRRVVGVANAEDQEILAEFYFRHFEITDESLTTLHQTQPAVYDQIGARLEKVKGIEYLTAEGFEARLGEQDILGKDDFARNRRLLLKLARMSHEPTEFVSDSDTHHLLYATALTPGWIKVGKKKDVPKKSAYVGAFQDTFVWVDPDHLEDLSRLTLAILDIHTFRSERIGGLRVQPGILPR